MHWAATACAVAVLAGVWQAARVNECGALLEDHAQLTTLMLARLAVKDRVLCVGACPAALYTAEAVFKRTFSEIPIVTRAAFEPRNHPNSDVMAWAQLQRGKTFDHVMLAAADLYNSTAYRQSLANSLAAGIVSRALRPGGTLTVVDLAAQNEEHKWILALCEAENMKMRSRIALPPAVPYRWLHEALHATQRALAVVWPERPSVLRCAQARADQAAGASRLFVLTFEKHEGLRLQGSCLAPVRQTTA